MMTGWGFGQNELRWADNLSDLSMTKMAPVSRPTPSPLEWM